MNNTQTTNIQVEELLYDCSRQNAVLFMGFLLVYEMSAYVANDMIMPGMIEVMNSFNANESLLFASAEEH